MENDKFLKIRQIMNWQWDPVNIFEIGEENPEIDDEYDTYNKHILSRTDWTVESIVSYLNEIQKNMIGLGYREQQRCITLQTAQAIMAVLQSS